MSIQSVCNDETILRQNYEMKLVNDDYKGADAQKALNDFVELPETLSALHYSNIVCGVVRGALEMVRRDHPRRLPHRPACRSQPPAQCHVHGWLGFTRLLC